MSSDEAQISMTRIKQLQETYKVGSLTCLVVEYGLKLVASLDVI